MVPSWGRRGRQYGELPLVEGAAREGTRMRRDRDSGSSTCNDSLQFSWEEAREACGGRREVAVRLSEDAQQSKVGGLSLRGGELWHPGVNELSCGIADS